MSAIVTGTRPAIVEALEVAGFEVTVFNGPRRCTDYVCRTPTAVAQVIVRVSAKGQIEWADFWATSFPNAMRVTGARLIIGAVAAFLACRCAECLNPYA